MNTVLNNINQSRYFNDSTANTKIEEIKKHLDSPSDADKLESMKKLIAMLSKGRDVSEAFPQVVKNVIVKNLEIKKLVYMYLVHYAESQNDSALLSINTIQKSLNDQSQVIRASALRVMSSIRVIDIIEVIILAIEKSVKDTSPFVRKAAAFAIAKVHKLDCDKQEPLIDLLEILLNDTSTMVLGAAIVAFNELCPQRFDLLHQHYRKICQLLADFDEWSQVIVLDILTKYARSQFRCPDSTMNDKNIKQFKKKSKSFYSDEEDQEDDEPENSLYKKKPLERDMFDSSEEIDMDHRLLLKSTLPLLQSRNNAVVMAVSSLYFYCAPSIEAQKVGKSLVRILRSGPEVQYITLTNISTMVTLRPSMFEPHLSEFFIHSSDPEYSIKLKLEILTRLATPENIGKILKEFKEYVKNEDKKFVAATIQAIGSCASTVPDVTESCIYGLMSLLSNQSTVVVAESVIVLKRLLQLNATNEKLEKLEKEKEKEKDVKENQSTISKHSSSNNSIKYDNIILHLSKLLDTLQVPSARASIVWVIGEYCYRVPLVAPDVFRKLVKSFSDEHESVKLETLNLGSKLYVQFTDNNSTTTTDNSIPNEFKNERTKEKITLMFQYVLNLAKFDQNYDIRDNSRMLKHFYFNTENTQSINSNIKQIVINQKPIPTETSISEDRQRFTLGSLSHIVNHTALGYTALPDFPDVAPDPSVREPIQRWIPNQQSQQQQHQQQQLNNIFVDTPFYSDEEEEDEEEYDEEEEEEEYEEQNEYEDFFGEEKKNKKKNRKQQNYDEDEYNQDIDDGEYDGEGEVQAEDEDDFDELFGITNDDNNQTANGIGGGGSGGDSNSNRKKVVWAQGEECSVVVTLSNPFSFDIFIQSLTLSTAGVPFESYPLSFKILSLTDSMDIVISGKPLESGPLIIKGVFVRAYNLLSEHPVDPYGNSISISQYNELVRIGDAYKVDILEFDSTTTASNNTSSFSRDNNNNNELPIVNKIKATPKLPILKADVPTLGKVLNLLAGESFSFNLEFQNIGTTQIDSISVSLNEFDKALKKKTLADNNQYFTDSDDETISFQWDSNIIKSSLPLLPGETFKLPIKSFSKPFLIGNQFIIDYYSNCENEEEEEEFNNTTTTTNTNTQTLTVTGNTQSTLTATTTTTATKYQRKITIPLPLSITHGPQVINFDIVYASSKIIKSLSPYLVDRSTSNNGLFKVEKDQDLIEKDCENIYNDYCLLLFDIKNCTSTHTFTISSELELGIPNIVDNNKEINNNLSSKFILSPNGIITIIVPMKRESLPDQLPPLRQAKGQYIKPKKKLTEYEEYVKCLIQYYKDLLTSKIKLLWNSSDNTNGSILLDNIVLTSKLIHKLNKDQVLIQFKNNKQLVKTIEQGGFETIEVLVTNLTNTPINGLVLHILPIIDQTNNNNNGNNKNNGNIVDVSNKLGYIGSLTTPIQELPVGATFNHSLDVIFFERESYKFIISCEIFKTKQIIPASHSLLVNVV